LSVIFLFFHPDHLSSVIQSAAVEQDTGVVSAGVGDNVTLVYKHEKLATVSKWLVEITRFSVQREEGANHLHISDVHLFDSATYFCGSSHSNMVEFGEGVFLSVRAKLQELQDIPQGPESVTVLPGGSVTLNCTVNTGTCDGEHRVCWFRHGSRPGIIHAHGDQCHRVSAPAGSLSHSCVYHLQRMNLTSLDTGTYHCAMASCGEVLFSSGSKVLVTDDTEDRTAQMRFLVCLSIVRAAILVLFLTGCLSVYSTKSRQPPQS
uniref:Ig-like domain-containing protein n=1 Tax=Scophthalmus maximus TaxID=52904 RepID=A0A8D3D3C7_SCOMX